MNYYKRITERKTEMEESEDIDDYLGNFLDGVRDDVLMIGQISLEEVQVSEITFVDALENQFILQLQRHEAVKNLATAHA